MIPIPDPPDMGFLPQYARDLSLPPYRFVPGLNPHPTRDFKGPGRRTARGDNQAVWSPGEWKTMEPYLRGIDLFNRCFYWEAHEAWEPLWISHPPRAEPSLFIQGLIMIAAAHLKRHMEQVSASTILWESASAQLKPFAGRDYMGIEVSRFLAGMETFLRPGKAGTPPVFSSNAPVIVLRGFAAHP